MSEALTRTLMVTEVAKGAKSAAIPAPEKEPPTMRTFWGQIRDSAKLMSAPKTHLALEWSTIAPSMVYLLRKRVRPLIKTRNRRGPWRIVLGDSSNNNSIELLRPPVDAQSSVGRGLRYDFPESERPLLCPGSLTDTFDSGGVRCDVGVLFVVGVEPD